MHHDVLRAMVYHMPAAAAQGLQTFLGTVRLAMDAGRALTQTQGPLAATVEWSAAVAAAAAALSASCPLRDCQVHLWVATSVAALSAAAGVQAEKAGAGAWLKRAMDRWADGGEQEQGLSHSPIVAAWAAGSVWDAPGKEAVCPLVLPMALCLLPCCVLEKVACVGQYVTHVGENGMCLLPCYVSEKTGTCLSFHVREEPCLRGMSWGQEQKLMPLIHALIHSCAERMSATQKAADIKPLCTKGTKGLQDKRLNAAHALHPVLEHGHVCSEESDTNDALWSTEGLQQGGETGLPLHSRQLLAFIEFGSTCALCLRSATPQLEHQGFRNIPVSTTENLANLELGVACPLEALCLCPATPQLEHQGFHNIPVSTTEDLAYLELGVACPLEALCLCPATPQPKHQALDCLYVYVVYVCVCACVCQAHIVLGKPLAKHMKRLQAACAAANVQLILLPSGQAMLYASRAQPALQQVILSMHR
eukprot:1140267-Pelagomonas_calceolata.AAC.4